MLVRLAELDAAQLDRLDRVTFDAASEHSPGWLPTLAAAREEITDSLDRRGSIDRVIVDDGVPIGWVAAAPAWGAIWELHPMLVAPAYHRRGHGAMLARTIERDASERGAITMLVGTSDLTGSTSLAGVDLYADPLGALAAIRGDHPFQFWLRVGYRIVGVIPDAEGVGRPSIQLAKRIG